MHAYLHIILIDCCSSIFLKLLGVEKVDKKTITVRFKELKIADTYDQIPLFFTLKVKEKLSEKQVTRRKKSNATHIFTLLHSFLHFLLLCLLKLPLD
jgi:hypothetical protein